MCTEISTLLPRKISPEFSKGKHLTFEQALEKLPQILGESYYENSAMNTILRQEINRYNRLLSVIVRTIEELVKALKGEIMISKTCENVFNSFLLQKVPDEWELNAYPSLKPLSAWLKNLSKRTQFFSLWCKNTILFAEGTSNVNKYPKAIWISGFFFPQGKTINLKKFI